MKALRRVALALLLAIYLASLGAGWLVPAGYANQFRGTVEAAPSFRFPLGTDELGRDLLARLLYGSRVSLSLAPAAAALATLVGALVGVAAGYLGGWADTCLCRVMDLFLSIPWLFLLLGVRAALPLNVAPLESVGVTFLLLGLLGWAGPARILRAAARQIEREDFIVQARAVGCGPLRLVAGHLAPNLLPVLAAQFWMSIPVFILSEANLGFLGLGVAEPLPSWGNLLRELENYTALAHRPWLWAPLISLVLVVSLFQFILSGEEYAS